MSMQQLASGQASAEIPVNRNFQTLEHQAVYGQRQSAHSGLTWAYYGGRWGGFSVADGTLTLTDATTNYVVVALATGVISTSTTTTNWNDSTNYARVYRITTAGGVVTNNSGSDFDYRTGPGGVHGGSGATGSSSVATDAIWDAAGDLAYGTGANTATRLAIGTALQVLRVNAGATAVEWAAASGSVASDAIWDAKGDLAVGTGANTAARLAVAANDTMLMAASGETTGTKWATPVEVATAVQGDGLDADAAGFRGLPQNAQTGNYTLVASDAGKHIYHASGAGAGDTYTIPANGSVAFESGTAVTFTNMATDSVAIAITTDTLYLAGAGTTGTRTLAQYGVATALKLTSTTWIISGTGLT